MYNLFVPAQKYATSYKFYTKICKKKYHKYSQVLITRRPISGKSRYPDIFEFGYRIIMATYSIRSGLDLWPNILTGYRVIGCVITNHATLWLLYKVRLFEMLWYPDKITGFWSSGYQISGYMLKRQFDNRICPDISTWVYQFFIYSK